jgi:gamma-glutamyltranspeptidase / glutathione hydrolase
MYSVHQPISNDVETEVLHVEAGSVSRPEVYGGLGVVSSTHPLASAAGMRILQNGGNAFDAAAAAAFVLHVVEPEYNGLGGEMVALVKTAGAGRARVLCGQGVAPGRATAELFAGLGHAQIPAVGLLSATVPGAFGAWLLLLRDVGTASIRTILEPAVRIARSGIVVSRLLAKKIKLVKARLCEEGWNAACEVYLPNGDLPREGATLQNLPLAATLANIIGVAENAGGKRELQIEAARRHFYDGAMADAIARFVSSRDLSSDVLETGGLVSNDDLSGWQAGWEDSVHTAYRDWEVYKPSVWSQGPLFLENLNLLTAANLGAAKPTDPELLHLLVETAKLCFADRDAYFGDVPDAEDLLKKLLSADYAVGRVAGITDAAARQVLPGLRATTDGYGALATEAAQPRSPVVMESDTCHISVADRRGNVISVTPSGGWFQDSPVIPGLGFSLNTRAQMFNLTAGHPNCIGPGKRPRTTLSPTIAADGSRSCIAFGVPGADYQDQYGLQFFIRWLHCGLSLQRAVEAPAFRTEHFHSSSSPSRFKPNVVSVERRFSADELDALRRKGHEIAVKPDFHMSQLNVAMKDGAMLRGAASPAFQRGYAIAW